MDLVFSNVSPTFTKIRRCSGIGDGIASAPAGEHLHWCCRCRGAATGATGAAGGNFFLVTLDPSTLILRFYVTYRNIPPKI